jgi:phosphoesterase RecJ-like protein
MTVTVDARARAVEQLRTGERFLLVTHEHPDGDALGSLLAMHAVLSALGKDSHMFMAAAELPLPYEYSFFDLDGLVSEPPADIDERIVVFLDCGNIDRTPVDVVKREGGRILNLDHHHDNTLFGDINLVDAEASCTAEIVEGLLAEAGIPLAEGAPLALYVGLVTDTGRFAYVNTTPRAHRLAARLLEQGVQPAHVFATLFESLPLARQRLLGLALGRADVAAGGRLAITSLSRGDFESTGADDTASDGVVDALRAIEGVELAALVREPRDRSGPARKVSLRSRAGGLDCSAIARLRGGGGHPGAAGFSTDETAEEITAFLAEQAS